MSIGPTKAYISKLERILRSIGAKLSVIERVLLDSEKRECEERKKAKEKKD